MPRNERKVERLIAVRTEVTTARVATDRSHTSPSGFQASAEFGNHTAYGHGKTRAAALENLMDRCAAHGIVFRSLPL